MPIPTTHLQLIRRFKEVIETLRASNVAEITADNPKVLRIRASATVPTPKERAARQRDVYNLFYRYGAGVDNDEFNPGVEFHGETFIGVVTIVFEAFPDTDLLETSAIYHDAMQLIADELRLTPDSDEFGISDVRLGVQSLTSTAASVERLEFQIEIDWYYP